MSEFYKMTLHSLKTHTSTNIEKKSNSVRIAMAKMALGLKRHRPLNIQSNLSELAKRREIQYFPRKMSYYLGYS